MLAVIMAGYEDEGLHFLGVDIGGTRVKLGTWRTGSRSVASYRELPTRAHRPREQVLGDITEAVAAAAKSVREQGGTVAGLGIGIPAALSKEGKVEVLPNFAPGWSGSSPGEELAASTSIPAVLMNDARAFTLAESTFGAAAGSRAALGVTLGTGVGGGLVFDGRLHLGPSGKAGELGHHVVEPGGPLCGCGSCGCLETVASATALVASVTRAFLQGASPVLRELTDGRFEKLDAAVIAEAVRRGDPISRDAVRRVAEYLGIAIANVATLTGIDTAVIGGGMAGMNEVLLEPLRDSLARHAPVLGENLPVVRSAELGDAAGVLGTALNASLVFGQGAEQLLAASSSPPGTP